MCFFGITISVGQYGWKIVEIKNNELSTGVLSDGKSACHEGVIGKLLNPMLAGKVEENK